MGRHHGDDWLDMGHRFNTSYRSLPDKTKNSKLRETAEVFVGNMNRIGSLSALLINLVFLSYQAGHNNAQIKQKLGRSQEDMSIEDDENAMDEANRILDRYVNRRGVSGHFEDMWNIGGVVLHAIIEAGDVYVKPGADALLSQIVVASWSAFESSAIDLWVNSVDTSLALAENVIKRKPSSSRGNEESEFSEEKTVKLNNLHRYGYDLRDKMGRVLVNEKKVRFESFNLLKSAYRAAFGNDSEDVFGKYPDLHVIEAIRHLIAHRAGVADQKFLKLVRSQNRFGYLKEGELIQLDAPYVADSIDSIVNCFVELFMFVDERVGHDERSKRER